MADARGFAAQIDNEFEAAMGEWSLIVQRVALDALKRIVEKTPVDTGRARGNWLVQIGSSGFEVSEATDKQGEFTFTRGASVIARYKVLDDENGIFIYNNLPYILALENGHSKKQAPNGMVAVTVAELSAGISG